MIALSPIKSYYTVDCTIQKQGTDYLLTGKWLQGIFSLFIDIGRMQELEANLSFHRESTLKVKVKCHFPTFSKSKLEIYFQKQQPFSVKIVYKRKVWKLHLYAKELREQFAKEFASRMNMHLFVSDSALMDAHVDALAENIHDRKERARIFWDVIKRSKDFPEWEIASANMLSIMARALIPFSLKNLIGVKAKGADLSQVILDTPKATHMDVRGVSLRNAFIRGVNFSELRTEELAIDPFLTLEHPCRITKIAISADGRLLACLGVNGHIFLWNVKEKCLLEAIPVFGDSAELRLGIYLEFSRDSQHLACAHEDGRLIILHFSDSITGLQWKLECKSIDELIQGTEADNFVLIINGKKIVSLDFIEYNKFQTTFLHVDSSRINNVSTCPITQEIAVINQEGTFTLISPGITFSRNFSIKKGPYIQFKFPFSKNLRYCVLQGAWQKGFQVIDFDTREVVYTHREYGRVLSFCNDDHFLLIESSNGLQLLQWPENKVSAELIFEKENLGSVCKTQDENFLYATFDTEVRIYRLDKRIADTKNFGKNLEFDINLKSFYFAVSEGDKIKLGKYNYILKKAWFLDKFIDLASFKGFIPNTSYVVEKTQNSVLVKHIENQNIFFTVDLPNAIDDAFVTVSANFKRIAFLSKKHDVLKIKELQGEKTLKTYHSQNKKRKIILSPNLDYFVEIPKSKKIFNNKFHLFDPSKGKTKILDIGNKKNIFGMSFCHDSSRLFVLCGKVAYKKVKNVSTSTTTLDEGAYTTTTTVHTNGSKDTVITEQFLELQVWDVFNSTRLKKAPMNLEIKEIIEDHLLLNMVVSNDGNLLATETFKGELLLLSPSSGVLKASLPHMENEKMIAIKFSQNDRYLAVLGARKSYHLWKLYDSKGLFKPHLVDRWPHPLVLHGVNIPGTRITL